MCVHACRRVYARLHVYVCMRVSTEAPIQPTTHLGCPWIASGVLFWPLSRNPSHPVLDLSPKPNHQSKAQGVRQGLYRSKSGQKIWWEVVMGIFFSAGCHAAELGFCLPLGWFAQHCADLTAAVSALLLTASPFTFKGTSHWKMNYIVILPPFNFCWVLSHEIWPRVAKY